MKRDASAPALVVLVAAIAVGFGAACSAAGSTSPGTASPFVVRTSSAAAVPAAAMPDPTRTPGEALPVGASDICVPGYAARTRDVSAETKAAVYAEYDITHHITGQYEVDHLIPLELGGSNDVKNLWPQPAEPRPGYHEKDDLENALHDLVCAGRLDLATAQRAIATDWYAAYVRYVLGK